MVAGRSGGVWPEDAGPRNGRDGLVRTAPRQFGDPMPQDQEPNWGRHLGLGIQVAVGAALGLWAGSWLDSRLDWTPCGTLGGLMLGLAAGLYLLVKEAMKTERR